MDPRKLSTDSCGALHQCGSFEKIAILSPRRCRILQSYGATGINSIKDGRIMEQGFVDTLISPEGKLEVLSKAEVVKLLDSGKGGLYKTFRQCALAVLNCGSTIDDGKELLDRYESFDI